jgi:cysteine desulfurase
MKPDFALNDVETYMDNAATTALDEQVIDAMRPFFEERYGNPETVYRLGREAKEAVESSRAVIADILRCSPEEIFFTSGGTEANNWAIKGVLGSRNDVGRMVSAIEHSSVLEPARWWSQNNPDDGYVEIPVDQFGLVDLAFLEKRLRHIALVSIQYANNEIGTVQPVSQIAELCKKYGAIFHCDAVQAFGKLNFDVDDVGADMMSLSAHKIHGPMGIGALYVKKGTSLSPLMHGGGQENGMRSGTLAVPEIVGFGKAAELAEAARPKAMKDLMIWTERLADQIVTYFNGKRNGHPKLRLPNLINVTLPNVETEVICGILCTQYGICMSAGAACSTMKRESHVLKAIGLNGSDVLNTMRISMSRFNTERDVDLVYARLQAAKKDAANRSLL